MAGFFRVGNFRYKYRLFITLGIPRVLYFTKY
jgi:hypothetical protein